jgi:hypothetical protein
MKARSSPSNLTRLPEGEVASWINALDQAADNPQSRALDESVWALRTAGAVLTSFDPATLAPYHPPGSFDEDARFTLFSEVVPVEGSELRCRLTTGTRRRALERLKSTTPAETRRRLAEALAANPRPTDPTQKMLDAIIEGHAPDPKTLQREQLGAFAIAAEWLGGIVDGLPMPADIAQFIGRADLLDPLQRLVGAKFVGREDELRRLADHVGELDVDRSGGILATAGQYLRRGGIALDEVYGGRRPLFLYGAGGVGKSSLVARFILNHATSESTTLPFVLLDVDRPSINPLRPLTFLVEALEQLALQLSGLQRPARQLAARILESLRARETVALETIIDSSDPLLRQFGDLIAPQTENRALLFIIDTFEEVQFLGPDAVGLVTRFLMQLGRVVPQVRIVVCGRARPTDKLFFTLEVTELPPEPAAALLVEYLKKNRKPLPTPAQIDEVVETIGGNPMVLNLAARLIAEQDLTGALKEGSKGWLYKVRTEAIQARLFGRVLEHVHDDDARKLAFPGLLVRRVTAPLILEVLAGPCKLAITTPVEAAQLLQKMASEIALVTRDKTDGSLIYRADIRRVMLETVGSAVSAETAREIDTLAVTFWSKQPGLIARAEDLYHRLRLDQTPTTLDSHWDPQLESLTRGALGEIPEKARTWLATKLDITVTADARVDALQGDWEIQAARTARRLLQDGQPASALQVLRERKERLGSRVPALEMRALYALDRLDELVQVGHPAIQKASEDGDAPGEAEIRLLTALAFERQTELEDARREATAASDVADAAGLNEWRFRSLVQRLRLDRRERRTQTPEYQQRLHLASQVSKLVDYSVFNDPALLRDAAAELGDVEPDLLRRAVDELGEEILQTSRRAQLRAILEVIGGMAPNIVATVIGGNIGEIARLAASILKEALYGGKGDPEKTRTVALAELREASDRAVHRRVASNEPSAKESTPIDRLGPQQLGALVDSIASSIVQPELKQIVSVYTAREIESFTSPSSPYKEQLFQLMRAAESQGWLPDLLKGLQTARPDVLQSIDPSDHTFTKGA